MSHTPSTPGGGAPAPETPPYLDAERLDVYRVALEFRELASALGVAGDAALRDQLRRASLSCVLNIAEGAAQWSRAQKRRYYRIALGSATESAALIDVLRVSGRVAGAECARARGLLVRIVQMLTRLDRRLI